MPVFPPPQVMLHSEDANSKVFHAIGRSFMAVVCHTLLCQFNVAAHTHIVVQDNRAMTIKDLAEMTMKFGLMCQKYVHPPLRVTLT